MRGIPDNLADAVLVSDPDYLRAVAGMIFYLGDVLEEQLNLRIDRQIADGQFYPGCVENTLGCLSASPRIVVSPAARFVQVGERLPQGTSTCADTAFVWSGTLGALCCCLGVTCQDPLSLGAGLVACAMSSRAKQQVGKVLVETVAEQPLMNHFLLV